MSPDELPGAELSRRLAKEKAEKARKTEFPDPEPLDAPLAPSAFPVDALPNFIADYCLGLAHQLQTPVDLPAVACLGALATAAGGRVEIQARPGWQEPLNLYLMAFSDPASRKTAVVKGPTAPLRTAEKILRELVRPKHIEALARQEIASKAASVAVVAASSSNDRDASMELEQVAVDARMLAEEIVVPPLPTILSEDSTPEALVGLMVENHGRAAVIAAETDALDTIVGRYAKASGKGSGGNLGILLKAHSGEGHRTNRKGRAAEDLPRTSLTLMLMGQPQVLSGMVGNSEWAGRGLLARLLLSVPDETVGWRTPGTAPVDAEVAAEYHRRIEELILDLAGVRTTRDGFGEHKTLVDEPDNPPLIFLSEEADDFLLAIENEIEPQLREDGRLGGNTGWGGKLAGATVRIAGLLHLVESPISEPVTQKTMERAWEIASYFADHALIAFRLAGVTEETNAHKVLAYLCQEKLAEFTVRDLHVALQGNHRFREVAAINEALATLEDKGWVSRQPTPERTGPGRKPSPKFFTHPKIRGSCNLRITAHSR